MNRLRIGQCTGILLLLSFCTFHQPATLLAQGEDGPGHGIGRISTAGNIIVVELNDGVLGKANLFNLAGRTLHFIREHSRYRVENVPLQWDSDFGPEASDGEVALHHFSFPFSGKAWNSFLVGVPGWISFGSGETENEDGKRNRGVSIGRFSPLGESGGRLLDNAPAIAAFFKPRTSGKRKMRLWACTRRFRERNNRWLRSQPMHIRNLPDIWTFRSSRFRSSMTLWFKLHSKRANR